MTAGLGWPEERFPGGGSGPQGTGPELFRQVLAREPAHEPGTVWSYADSDVNLLAGVLRQATGQHADEFGAEPLFAPLGITPGSRKVKLCPIPSMKTRCGLGST